VSGLGEIDVVAQAAVDGSQGAEEQMLDWEGKAGHVADRLHLLEAGVKVRHALLALPRRNVQVIFPAAAVGILAGDAEGDALAGDGLAKV
jgi:hypothetical protein